MAVSKRLRFEILKRDDHTCQYCGAKAPDVKLHVDHVVPTSLGGSDKPSNLVAACVDCNSGKGSAAQSDAPVPAATLDAARWKKAVTEAGDIRRATREGEQQARDIFERRWPWSSKPDEWGKSCDTFIRQGLTPQDIDYILERSVERTTGFDHAWHYFCKVCWSEINAIRDAAAEAIAAAQPPPEVAPAVKAVVDLVNEMRVENGPRLELLRPRLHAPCIECDDRPAAPVASSGIEDGLCTTCRRFHYEGTA